MSESLQISIGDVAISIEGDLPWRGRKVASAYRPFIRRGTPDISLRLHVEAFRLHAGKKVFECPPVWALYRQNGTSVVKLFQDLPDVARTLVFSSHLERAELYFEDAWGRYNDFSYGPTMELLMMNYLEQGRGVIMHSCGIEKNGKGILFVGESGAGKSTLSKLWDQENGVDVLSDDRIIVRKKRDQFWMYGTPWHGDAKFASPEKVRLERIFFLRHGHENAINEVKGIDPVPQLLTCSFPPLWNAQGMAYALEMFSDLADMVPCQELTFRPDRAALQLIERSAKF